MKRIFFSILLLILPLLIFSQTATWNNATGNNNWSDNGNWDTNYPNGAGAVAKFGSVAGTINLTEDISVKLINLIANGNKQKLPSFGKTWQGTIKPIKTQRKSTNNLARNKQTSVFNVIYDNVCY